jgi:hypothetical protein
MVSANGYLYWTAVETDGTGSVWAASTCVGALPAKLAHGLGRPSSIVIDATRVAWVEDRSSVRSMALTGGDVTTVANYSTAAPGGSTVEYLAQSGGSLYWLGLHYNCSSSTGCQGFTPYVATGRGGYAPVELFAGVPANSWSNLLVDERGITLVQESAAPPGSPNAVLLRVPLTGGHASTLDIEVQTAFTGNALAPCGADVCWFGHTIAAPGAMSLVRVSDGALPQRTTLPLSASPGQDIFLAMDADRVYYLEGNFDTYRPPNAVLRSMTASGQDSRFVGSPQMLAGTAAIAFDAQNVYLAAAEGIRVVAK